ncbi:hypothetical protein ACLETV_19810 [Citrobacter braakii]|jgi:superfamily I DNA and/or RNA helicase|uniref:hypothetical protein n=1 Tax=Citrobacter braakii TaxID=57706 RepID=UPI003975EBB0
METRQWQDKLNLSPLRKSNLPNIINVAVSRAKKNLYVVGSAAAWEGTSLQLLQRQLAESA